MITEKELHEAIAECLGERNPNSNTCIKLASFYTILNELYPSRQIEFDRLQSFDASPVVTFDSDSEFAMIAKKATPELVWSVMDELMATLKVLYPKLYDGVMRKLEE